MLVSTYLTGRKQDEQIDSLQDPIHSPYGLFPHIAICVSSPWLPLPPWFSSLPLGLVPSKGRNASSLCAPLESERSVLTARCGAGSGSGLLLVSTYAMRLSL
jgi:hypothetical protein